MGSSHGKSSVKNTSASANRHLVQQIAILQTRDGEEKLAWEAVKSQGHALREADMLMQQVENDSLATDGKGHSGGGAPVPQTAMAIPEKVQKTAGSEKAMPFVHVYVRCEDLAPYKGKAVTSMVVVYSKLLHEETWTEVGRSDIVEDASSPEFEKRFNIAFCPEVVRLVRFEVYRVKVRSLSRDGTAMLQRFIGGFDCRIIHLISARSVEGAWVMRDLLGLDGANVGRLLVWAEEDNAGKSMVMFNLSARDLCYTDVWKHTTDAYFIVHRAESRSEDPPEKCTKIDTPDANAWQTAASKASAVQGKKGRHAQTHATMSVKAIDWAVRPKPEFAVWRSEVIRHQRSPTWTRVEDVQSQELSDGDSKCSILIEVWDWFRIAAPRHIGTAETCFEDMYLASRKQKPLLLQLTRMETRCCCSSSGGSSTVIPSGMLNMEKIQIDRRFTFLDFIRGGLEIIPLFAVDMTRGNLDPDNPKSLHGAPKTGRTLNDYATSLKAVCEVFQSYQGRDSSDAFPVYGFGARIPPAHAKCSHCFALGGDFLLPHCVGVPGVLDAYHQSLQVVDFHGPTKFTELLHMAAKWAKPFLDLQKAEGQSAVSQQKYFVLVIITKGSLEDEHATVRAISKLVGLPLSISIIGIGNTGHNFLEGLGEEVKAWQQLTLQVCCRMGHVCQQVAQTSQHRTSIACEECGKKVSTCKTRWDCEDCATSLCEKCGIWVAQKMAKEPVYRDMVSYTRFNDFADDAHGLAAAAFAGVPEQLLSYYKLADAKPRSLDKFETEHGLPLRRKDVVPPKTKKHPERKRREVGSKDASRDMHSSQHSHAFLSEFARDEIAKEFDELAIVQRVCPTFLAERRVEMQAEAEQLGYLKAQVHTALDDGIAEDSMEVLVEAIVYGFQDMPSYKQAARDARAKVFARSAEDAKKSAAKKQRQITYDGIVSKSGMFEDAPQLIEHLQHEDSVVELAPQRSLLRNVADDAIYERRSSEQLFMISPKAKVLPGMLREDANLLEVDDLGNEDEVLLSTLCSICYERPVNVELLPCHHKVACDQCISKAGTLCPLCRKSIESRVIL